MQPNIPTQVGPNSVDPLTKRGAANQEKRPQMPPQLPGDAPEKNIPQSLPEDPGDHRQNPADPTRKDGDVPPIYAEDNRLQAGEDMQEPTPTREGNSIDRNPRSSGEVSRVY